MKKMGYLLMITLILVMFVYPSTDHQQANALPFTENIHSRAQLSGNHSTYFGGVSIEEEPVMTIDKDGNMIIIGQTISSNLPVTAGVFQNESLGARDGFVAKFDPSGSLVFCSYLGGSDRDQLERVTTDSEGNIILVGATESDDFPVQDAYQSEYVAFKDAFVTKMSPDGSSILFSSYLGGSLDDWIFDVLVDENDDILFCGFSASDGLGTPGAYWEHNEGGVDWIIGKMYANGSGIDWLTYFGGENIDHGFGIEIDSNGDIIVAGLTRSLNISLVDAYQDQYAGGFDDILITKFNHNCSELLFGTFLGGNRSERMKDMCLDQDDNIWLCGHSESYNFPTVAAIQDSFAGGSTDALIFKFSNDGQLEFSSYYGTSSEDQAFGITVDSHGNPIIVGRTSSDDFITTDYCLQDTLNGINDAYILNMSSDGQTIYGSTLFGGSGAEMAENVLLDMTGQLIVTGTTTSDDLPTSSSAVQPTSGGSDDVFIVWNPLKTFPPDTTPITTDPTSTITDSTSTDTTSGTQPLDMTLLLIAGGVVVGLVIIIGFVKMKR